MRATRGCGSQPCSESGATEIRRLLYSSGMTGRIGAKGQVVIPKALRDRARLHPGDEVDFELREEEIVLVARRSPLKLGGRFAKTGMAARLIEDRAREPR
jgi:AbrB family looped-hinge helix DNA binding protein